MSPPFRCRRALGSIALIALACAAPAASAATNEPDRTALPLGDGRATTAGPQPGYLYVCRPGNPSAPGAAVDGPWINSAAGTYNLFGKYVVDGSNDHPDAEFRRKLKKKLLKLSGNGLPTNHGTGNFPISPSDDAARVDRNPNPVQATVVSAILKASPRKAASPSCTAGGVIGIARNGVAFYNAVDARGDDAVAHEVQDACSGHPQQQGQYHYHGLPACLSYGSEKRHSKLIGWILDGFPIYGPIGEDGEYMRTGDLDACHGHTHRVRYLGETAKLYHYHATEEYPYTIGCFRGTPSGP
jgi:hypothetical protein